MAYVLLALAVWSHYGDFSRWPVNSSSDAHGLGFELTGAGTIVLMFTPLIAAPAAMLTSLVLLLCFVSDLVETKGKSWRTLVHPTSRQLGVSIAATILLLPVFGRVLGWVID